jgi:hypothetical protein
MADDSWLDSGPTKNNLPIKAAAEENPRRRALVESLFALTWRQRRYLEALNDCAFDDRAARKASGVTKAQLRRWATEPTYQRAVRLLEGIVTDDVSFTRAAVLAKMSRLADDTRKLVTRTDANGNVVAEPVDGPTARGTLKDLAQALGFLEPERQTKVVVQVIDMSGDNEPGRVIEAGRE